MPYKSIDELPDSVKVLPKEAQELFLEVVNDALERYDNEGQAFAVAWSVIKKKWKKVGDKWVRKSSGLTSAEEPLILEGPAFPIGKKNANGWGVPESEVDNAIKSLKTAVVRVCTRDDEHGCDTSEDPFAEIGRVLDAWRENGYVKTRVAIADRIAKQKIEDGVWEPHWSVYGHADKIKDGWAYGINIKSLTLVRNPAWKEATFNIASADDSGVDFEILFLKSISGGGSKMKGIEEYPPEELELGAAKWTRAYINDLPDSAFAYIEPCYKRGDTKNKNARHLPYKNHKGEIDLPHLRNALARVSQIKPICPDTDREEAIRKARAVLENAAKKAKIGEYAQASGEEVEMKEEFEKKIKELEASIKELEKQKTELEAAIRKKDEEITALKAEKETMLTKEQVEELIAAKIAEKEEELKREALASEIVEMQIKAGLLKGEDAEAKKAALKEICSAKLSEIHADFSKLIEKVKGAKDYRFPADEARDEGLIKWSE